MPALNTGTAEILIFINDDEDKNEETFGVKVNYISENDEDWKEESYRIFWEVS